jgi:hypothetical protein
MAYKVPTLKELMAGKCFHLAGDSRLMRGMDAEQQVGDYLITPDMTKVYKVVSPGMTQRVEGAEFDTVIHHAKLIQAEMVRAAIARDEALGKQPLVKKETVEENIKRLQKERVSGKHKAVNPENFTMPEDVH